MEPGANSKRFDGVLHVGVDAKLARNGQRFAHDVFCAQIGVVQQRLGGGVGIGAAGADGDDALLGFEHVAIAGDDERGFAVGLPKNYFQLLDPFPAP